MATAQTIRTILELLAVLFVIYGVLHEQKFINFENRIIKAVKGYLNQRKKGVMTK